MLIIIYPVVNLVIGDKINFETILTSYSFEEKIDTSKQTNLNQKTNKQIEDLYTKEMKNQIEKEITEKGYSLNDIQIKINLEYENNYGEIIEMKIKVSKPKTKNETNIIKPIEIKIENNVVEEETLITKTEIDELKNMLEEKYKLTKDKIEIEVG